MENQVKVVNGEDMDQVVMNGELVNSEPKAADIFSVQRQSIITSEATPTLFSEMDDADLLGAGGTTLGESDNVKIDIVKLVAGDVTITDSETGEVQDRVRAVMRGADGNIYSTVSKSAVLKLSQFLNIFQRYEIAMSKEFPLPIIVKMQKTNTAGHKVTTISVDQEKFAKIAAKAQNNK